MFTDLTKTFLNIQEFKLKDIFTMYEIYCLVHDSPHIIKD